MQHGSIGSAAPAVVGDLLDGDLFWLLVAAVVVVALLIAGLTYWNRVLGRRRRELRDSARADIEPLLVTRLSSIPTEGRDPAGSTDTPHMAGGDTPGGDTTPGGVTADEVEAHTERVGETLAELTRISRSETAAAATALRHHAVELGRALTSRLRGESDPHLLEVRITELRERVRGAQDRLDAAVGR